MRCTICVWCVSGVQLIFHEPEARKDTQRSSLCVRAKNRQISVCGERCANRSQMAQRRFAVPSTHMCIWFANHSACLCIRDFTIPCKQQATSEAQHIVSARRKHATMASLIYKTLTILPEYILLFTFTYIQCGPKVSSHGPKKFLGGHEHFLGEGVILHQKLL